MQEILSWWRKRRMAPSGPVLPVQRSTPRQAPLEELHREIRDAVVCISIPAEGATP